MNPSLRPLIDAYCHGTATEAQLTELADALRTCADARRAFAEALDIHAALRWRETSATRAPERTASAGRPHNTSEPESFPIYRKGHAPNPKSETRIPKLAIAFSIAAALLAACGLAIYVLSLNPEPSPPEPPAQPLANLIENASGGTLTTPGGFISEGRDYPRGEYTLEKGTAEFMLTNAVNVKLRGETRMVMRNNMNVALTRGSAEFVVPKEATGFTVHLPDRSTIVDLGTAFKIEIDEAGETKFRVTEGEVEWTPAGSIAGGGSDAEPLRVGAGQNARIVDGRLVVSDITAVVVTPDHIQGVPTYAVTGTLLAIDEPSSIDTTTNIINGPAGPDWPEDADDGFSVLSGAQIASNEWRPNMWEPDGTPDTGDNVSYMFNKPGQSVTYTFDLPDGATIHNVYATWSHQGNSGTGHTHTYDEGTLTTFTKTVAASSTGDLVLQWRAADASTHNAKFQRIFAGDITVAGGDGFVVTFTAGPTANNFPYIDAVVIDFSPKTTHSPDQPDTPQPQTDNRQRAGDKTRKE